MCIDNLLNSYFTATAHLVLHCFSKLQLLVSLFHFTSYCIKILSLILSNPFICFSFLLISTVFYSSFLFSSLHFSPLSFSLHFSSLQFSSLFTSPLLSSLLCFPRVRNGSRLTPNILFGGPGPVSEIDTPAPKNRNAFERHKAAMKCVLYVHHFLELFYCSIIF